MPPDGSHFKQAVKKAGIDPVISQVANGYDTGLGKCFESGQELSTGEWQKVAIARAFLHDGEIIVLDEPASALDAKAEHEIFERFHQLVKGKTAILISHRLSTVKMVDRIYVLNHGRIVESGTHDELMKEQGVMQGCLKRRRKDTVDFFNCQKTNSELNDFRCSWFESRYAFSEYDASRKN